MRAELKVSTVILLVVFLVFIVQFGSGIVFSQSYNTLRVESGFGDVDNFAVGAKISITCFGNIEIYKEGELKKKDLGNLEYTPQEPGEYLIKCGDETKFITVKDIIFVKEKVEENPEIFVKEETKIISNAPETPIQIVTTVSPEPEILPTTNFSTLSIKTLQPTQKCVSGECTLIINSPTKILVDSAGVHVNFTDVVDFEWNNNSFYISWPNSSLKIDTFAVYNGTRHSFDVLQTRFPGFEVDGIIDDNDEVYKYGLNISNIPSSFAENLEYVGLELVDIKGITWNEIKETSAGIIINDEIHLGFNDLLKNFTLSIVNKSIILIGGVGNKSELWLDPTIQLQTADTENLRDAYVYGRVGVYQDTNYGADNQLMLWDRTTRLTRTYIMFNISTIPSSSQIDDAKLCLYLYSNGATPSASVYHVYDSTWDGQTESSITWNNQVCGTGFDDSGDCNLTTEDTQNTNAVGWVCWNITNMITDDCGEGDNNISMVLVTPESGNNLQDRFCSKESTTGSPTGCSVSQRPYLNITYTDNHPPTYSNIIQSPSGNPDYEISVHCNSTWEDNVDLSTVIFRSNYTGSWQNYTPSNSGSVYNYTIPTSQLTGGEVVGWNYWANDTAANWNNSMPIQSFTVQKATPILNLYLNGTDDDRGYYYNDTANFTVVLSYSGGAIELWTNLTGVMQLWNSGLSPLENITMLDYSYGIYIIKGNFSGNENYTAAEEIHYITIAQDPVKPIIIEVSPVNQTYGIGKFITIQANVTDNIAVDSVILNLTLPGGSPELYEMVNISQDIYQYSFYGWDTGTYYYEIIANDTSGNVQTYISYIYIHGNATLNVFAEKDSYGLGENVTLVKGQNFISVNLESGTVQKQAQLLEAEWVALTYDDFESGFGSYTDGGSACFLYTGGTYAYQESNAADIQDNLGDASSFYHTNRLDVDTPDYISIKIDFWFYAVGMEAAEDFWVRYSDDDGSSWATVADYNSGTEFVNGQFYNETVYINESDYTFSTDAKIRFQCDASNQGDDIYIDEVNVSATMGPVQEVEVNISYTNYTDVFSGTAESITRLEIILNISVYNNSGSLARGNNNSDLQLELYNGSEWIFIDKFNINETGNTSLFTINSTILNSWETEENRDLRIKGINFDYNGSSGIDEINWTGVWVKYYNGSSLLNTGSLNISGHLLMQAQTNSSGEWVVVDTVINDTNTSTLRDISVSEYLDVGSAWNANAWNTNSYPTGDYRIYAALVDEYGNVLQGDDGISIENSDEFVITILGDISATPQTTGYGQTVLISAEVLDPTTDKIFIYLAKPGEGFVKYNMTNISSTIYQYNYSDMWIWGDYNYYIWVNNSAGSNSTSDTYQFYLRADTTLDIYTINESYGPNEDVDLGSSSDWWNFYWGYRQQVNVTEPGVYDRLNWPVDVHITTNNNSNNCTKDFRVVDDNNNTIPHKVYNESGNCSGANVVFLVNETKDQTRIYYVYYGNPNAQEINYDIWKDSCSVAENSTICSSIYYSNYEISSGSAFGLDSDWDTTTDITPANDVCTSRNLPWNFSFFNQTILTTQTVYIEDNGFVNFDTSCSGNSNPNTGTFKILPMIAPIWSDWRCDRLTSNGLFENTFTNKTIWTWDCDAVSQESYTEMQSVLYKTGDIMLRYGSVTGTSYRSGSLAGISNGDNVSYFNNKHDLNTNIPTAFLQYSGSGVISIRGEENAPPQSAELKNLGSTNISGYFEMRVQRYSGGSWIGFEAPFINDRIPPQTLRNITAGEILMLDNIWNPAGWSTSSNYVGVYRAFVRLTDSSGNTLRNDDTSLIRGWYNFTIISGELKLIEVEHENGYESGLDEYETGDNISWVNITITNYNTTSLNASITLNILDFSGSAVSWGPLTETKYCGDLDSDQSCEKQFDNNTAGYMIPLTATSNYYNFFWNVTLNSETGTTVHNDSFTFAVHHIPDNLSSILSPDKIFQNHSTTYNFTIINPWSSNLVNINATINCPDIAGLNCTCIDTGLGYCNLSSLNSLASYTFSFNISTTNNTPPGDYNLNVTLNYTNPGSEFRSWAEQQNQLLKIRIPGQFVEIILSPVNITRGGYGNISGYSNNTLDSSMHNVTMNWTIPSGWSNSTGNLSIFDEEQIIGEMLWNNVTVYVNLSAGLGPQTIQLKSDSEEGYQDWDTEIIDIYANTQIINLQSNNTDPVKGNSIVVSGRLVLDNGTALSGKNVSVNDTTDNVLVGSDLTDSNGWFYIYYLVPETVSFGVHNFNASFAGVPSEYYLETHNTTNIAVHGEPVIMDVSGYPDPQGYGYNVTIKANVTDLDGIENVKVYIQAPGESYISYDMINYTSDIYEYNYSDTWTWGNYSYYIWANNSASKNSQSPVYVFQVKMNAILTIKTVKDAYPPVDWVNLTNLTATGYPSIGYDTLVMSNGSRTDNVNLSEIGDVTKSYDETCNSENIILGLESSGIYTDTHAEGGNVRVINEEDTGGGNSDYEIEVWYTFNAQVNESDVSEIKFSTDAWSAEVISIDAYNYDTSSWVDTGSDVSASETTQNITICASGCDAYIDNSTGNIRIRYDDDINTEVTQNSLSIDYQAILFTTSVIERYYIKFDLSEIPAGAVILDANLTFYVSTSNAADGEVHHANETFTLSTPVTEIYNDGKPSECSETNPIGNFSASTIGNKIINATTSVVESYGAGKKTIAYFINESGEDNYFVIDGSHGNNPPELKIVYETKSQLSNLGSVGMRGYLTMKVQKYSAGVWQEISGGVIVSNESHNISADNYLGLDEIWNPISWYTNEHPAGIYRVLSYMTDPEGNILKNDDGSNLSGYYEFNITQPSAVIQLMDMRLYDITNATSPKSDTSNLIGNGTNTTYKLFTDKVYRVEIEVWNNDTSDSAWLITSSDMISHDNLNETWNVDNLNNIWYANTTNNFTGGNWSGGKITWNTSLNGTLEVNDTMIFYYIFNITTADEENYPVHLVIDSTQFTLEDYSLYEVFVSESQPPELYNFFYDISADNVYRNESICVYARWDESIGQALAEYNSTGPGFENYSISLPNPNPCNWTNYTEILNSSWSLGQHEVKIYAADLNMNWNNTLDYLTFTVWGWSSVADSYLDNYTINNGSSARMHCKINSDNGSSLTGYNISFYNSTSYLGSNQTNVSGWASWTFIDNSLGYEDITCNITNNEEEYYHTTLNNSRVETLRTIETVPPWYTNITQNVSKVYRGGSVLYSVQWYDNVLLEYGWLESNESGVWQNNSLASSYNIDSVSELVEFEASIPTTANLGLMAWRVYANDSSSNINVTSPPNYTDVWGYAIINESSLLPNLIYVNNTTVINCRVVDYHNGSSIGDYNVSFYSNESGYLGLNQTNASGWASWIYNDTTLGWEAITCNITSDSSNYYDPHEPFNASYNLHTVALGVDTSPPANLVYSLNDSLVWKGQSVLAYAQWNETVGGANITYNLTSSDLETFTPDTITGNWTNHTISTNSSWTVGIHYVKINASDNSNNWNNSLSFLNFTVWGRSKIEWQSPSADIDRGMVPLRCRVYDKDGNYGIENYQVNFYNESWDYLGFANTNSTGIATYNWDGQNEQTGSKIFYCLMSNISYYKTINEDDDATGNFNLLGKLNVTIDTPLDGYIYHKGDMVQLNSTTVDENDQQVTPDNVIWYNSTDDQIATGENTNWTIPVNHELGLKLIKVNSSKTYYDDGLDNVSIEVWGWSNVTWGTPIGGNYSIGTLIDLICSVEDVNSSDKIENYPVNFYYQNSTEVDWHFISSNTTNSTGQAIVYWDTAGLIADNYTTMCNITHNSTLYYNVTEDNKANTTIELNSSAAGILEVFLMLPPSIPGKGDADSNEGYKVGMNKTFVLKANVTCRGGDCGIVQGTLRYNTSGTEPDTAVSVGYATPFYIVDSSNGSAQNPVSCGTLNENESCVLNWTINSTGNLYTFWNLDVLFTGTQSSNNNTNNTKMRISIVLIMSLSNYQLSATVEPSWPDVNKVELTGGPVYVTINENSNDAEGIYIKGTNLTGPSGYSMYVENMSYAFVNNSGVSTDIAESYENLLSPAPAGTNQPTYYWINTPQGMTTGYYYGYIYIMANATG